MVNADDIALYVVVAVVVILIIGVVIMPSESVREADGTQSGLKSKLQKQQNPVVSSETCESPYKCGEILDRLQYPYNNDFSGWVSDQAIADANKLNDRLTLEANGHREGEYCDRGREPESAISSTRAFNRPGCQCMMDGCDKCCGVNKLAVGNLMNLPEDSNSDWNRVLSNPVCHIRRGESQLGVAAPGFTLQKPADPVRYASMLDVPCNSAVLCGNFLTSDSHIKQYLEKGGDEPCCKGALEDSFPENLRNHIINKHPHVTATKLSKFYKRCSDGGVYPVEKKNTKHEGVMTVDQCEKKCTTDKECGAFQLSKNGQCITIHNDNAVAGKKALGDDAVYINTLLDAKCPV